MGTYEVLERSSEESFRDIAELKTPSPLRSSESSESNKSLLNGITELLERGLVRDLDDKFVGRSANRDFSGYLKLGEKLEKDCGNLSSSSERSSSSSPSSLKQRIRDFPKSSGNPKFSDRLAALDRRIRRERDAYLQLLDSNDRIDEKDEGETSVPDEIVMIAPDSSSNNGRNDARGRSRRGGNSSFSAPESTRLEVEKYPQRLKKFEESRPPKYLRPIEPPGKEIIRSNAPPLCLTDEKIVQLLRRGSASAREENLRKSKSARAPVKLAAYGKPTGLIIQNLSSGSEGDDCTEVGGENGKFSGSIVTSLERETGRDQTKLGEIKDGEVLSAPKENVHTSARVSSLPSEVSNCLNLRRSGGRSNEDTDVSDDPGSSGSGKRMRNNAGRLKSVVENAIEKLSDDKRSMLVPRLEMKSQDFSRSTSIASREDVTKRSFDVDQLIRALSDVSIQQKIDRQIAWADHHFPVSGSSSRLEKKVDNRPEIDNDRSKLRRSNDSIASHNERQGKCQEKMSYSKSSDYIESSDNKSSKASKVIESLRIKPFGRKNNFGSIDCLKQRGREKMGRSALEGQLSEPVTSRNRRVGQIITEYSSSRDRISNSSREDVASKSESCSGGYQDGRRITKGKHLKSSNNQVEINNFISNEKNVQNDSNVANKYGSDGASKASFNIYEDPCEDLTKGNKNLSSETSEASPGLTTAKDRSPSEDYETNSNRRKWKNPSARNLFWADNSSELSRGMASGSSDCRSREFGKDLYYSGSRSCLVSPGVSLQALSKLSSSSVTDTSRCSSEDSPGVSKNGKRLDIRATVNKETETGIGSENIFSPSRSIIKRLSYEEIHERVESIDSPRRVLGKKTERSESAVDALRKALDASPRYRGKISSSLSRLEASPNDSRRNSSNFAARKRSQDRSPFTITCGKSSPPLSNAERNEQSETTYRLGFNPSRVRLVDGGIELSTVEVNNGFSNYPDTPSCEKRRPFVPKIRKFVRKFSRWRRSKPGEERSNDKEKTRILYENKACRMGEASSANTSNSAAMTTERPSSNRDGQWVVGFCDETKAAKESAKTLNAFYGDNEKYEFIATRNFREEDEPDIDRGRGCFCAKFCRFLIGGDDYYRYSFPSGPSGFTQ